MKKVHNTYLSLPKNCEAELDDLCCFHEGKFDFPMLRNELVVLEYGSIFVGVLKSNSIKN